MFLVTGHPIFISCRHVFNAEVRDVTRRCLPYVYYLAISLMTFESSRFFAKNDLLTMHYDYPGTELDNTITNVYTYDANGYVLTANDGETQTQFEY